MFPLRDHNPSTTTPWVVWALMAANIGIWLATLPLEIDPDALFALYLNFAMIPARLSWGEGHVTLLTSMFLHAGFLHLAGNMLFLWIFGDNLEEALGHLGFLGFYLAAGAGSALAQYLSAPMSEVPVIGASGAVAGVMGGYLLLFPRARVDILLIFIVFFKVVPVPAWIMLGLWFAVQLIGGVGADPDAGGIAYWAHAGGFLLGMLGVMPAWLGRGGPAFWARTHGHPPHPAADYATVRTRVPRVGRRR